MRWRKNIVKMLMMAVFLSSTAFSTAHAHTLVFTSEEKEYIKTHPNISIMTYTDKGNVPIQYKDRNDEVKGITIEVLKRVEELTGFNFEYDTCKSIECAKGKKGDLYTPLSNKHQVKGLIPSATITSVSSSVFVNRYNPVKSEADLVGKKYAEISLRDVETFPDDVEVIYFNSREETIKAVNDGKADFGIGNDFSLTHYTSQGLYDNIITIPIPHSINEYSFGFINQDELFMQIINKAINAISKEEIQSIIYTLVYQDIDSGILYKFFNRYNEGILAFFLVLIFVFMWMIYKLSKARRQVYKENQHYTMLAKNSKELLFEYTFHSDKIHYWGENSVRADEFDTITIRNQVIHEIEKFLNLEEHLMRIVDVDGLIHHIRIRKTVIYDRRHNPVSVFGSMKDVSEEREYVELLELQSRTDGLTDLSNSRYLKEVITDRLKTKKPFVKDAFILFDLDNFKMVNDTYGHLKGDEVLIECANIIKEVFDDALVVARFGGDEFSVYIAKIESEEVVLSKINTIIKRIKGMAISIEIGVTAGVTFVLQQENFDVIFKEADDALYSGKQKGKKTLVVH